MDGFARVNAGVTSPAEFFSEENVGRIFGHGPARCRALGRRTSNLTVPTAGGGHAPPPVAARPSADCCQTPPHEAGNVLHAYDGPRRVAEKARRGAGQAGVPGEGGEGRGDEEEHPVPLGPSTPRSSSHGARASVGNDAYPCDIGALRRGFMVKSPERHPSATSNGNRPGRRLAPLARPASRSRPSDRRRVPECLGDRVGFTCCQSADLANPTSLLSERIDLMWVREGESFQAFALVTGRVPSSCRPRPTGRRTTGACSARCSSADRGRHHRCPARPRGQYPRARSKTFRRGWPAR